MINLWHILKNWTSGLLSHLSLIYISLGGSCCFIFIIYIFLWLQQRNPLWQIIRKAWDALYWVHPWSYTVTVLNHFASYYETNYLLSYCFIKSIYPYFAIQIVIKSGVQWLVVSRVTQNSLVFSLPNNLGLGFLQIFSLDWFLVPLEANLSLLHVCSQLIWSTRESC